MNFTRYIARSVFSLLFFIGGATQAQLNSDNLVLYKEKEGLPALQVNNVIADRHGFIWIGTSNGLARFDGYEFKRFFFNPNDTASFHGLGTWSIFEDRSGILWVGAAPSYLNAYNPVTKRFTQYPFVHLLKRNVVTETDVRSIVQDKRGRIYFGMDTYYSDHLENALVYKDENDDSLKLFKSPDNLPISNVISLALSDDDEIFAVTYTGVLRIDKDRHISKFDLINNVTVGKNDYPEDIVFDGEGNLWCVSENLRLYMVNRNLDSIMRYDLPQLKDDNRFRINTVLLAEKNGDLWIASDGGLSRFDRKSGTISKFNTGNNKQYGGYGVMSLAKDGFGNIWAGGFLDGLLKYENKPQFRSFTYQLDKPDAMAPGWASFIVEDRNDKLWIATGGSEKFSGLNRIDLKSGSVKVYPYRNLQPALGAVNGFWIGDSGELTLQGVMRRGNEIATGLFSFSETPEKLKSIKTEVYPNTPYLYRLRDSKGNEWLCTGSGLARKGSGKSSYQTYDLSKLPGANNTSNEITRVFESKKHGLWVLTNNGLFLYDYHTDKITRHGYDKNSGDVLITQDINSLYEGEDGIVWIGTWQGGLGRYDVENKKIKTYTRDDGLPSMSVQAILPDTKTNSLWLSTFEGLSRFDIAKGKFNNYSLADGIQGLLFADGGALITRDGHYVFGGNNGITVFKPEEIGTVSTPPRVLLTDLKLFNKSVFPGEGSVLKKPIFETNEITLRHDQNNISFDFVAIHFSNPSKNKYAYKLENYDNDWLDVGSLHTAFYPNLSPGEYVFRVKAANDQGVWNEKGVTVKITVLPPWWRTIWAYIGYALLLGIIAFFMDRYLRHRILEKEREKNRNRELEQAREIQKAYANLEQAHEALKATQKQLIQSEKMASLGELTAGIAHEIQNPLNFVNNFSEVNKELSDELIEAAEKGNLDEVKQIASDIRLNDEKIRSHGKRADSIVKSMLMHSRANSGQKESVDINALVDEYVRLSYHGLRARDKNFNVELDTKYDTSIRNVHAIPQEIGRVILNLVNNAFYAVTERKKSAADGYSPKVTITTSPGKNGVDITVADNGTGIPDTIREKIMQPFFTTKPTGQGTGLGLSLSYDIIKTHGGDIILDSREGEGTTFVVRLPYES
ncbi:MAG TPA: two-component regulator propeller domain-containing protein [Chitinophagaceae bacterium]|nr:two-component regulator propeller domain-containing protein [Chitinophagaceae bacterium]